MPIIVLIDDDDQLRRLFHSALDQAGWNTCNAPTSSKDALDSSGLRG